MYNVRCILPSKLLPAVIVQTGPWDEGSMSVAKWMPLMPVHVDLVFGSYDMPTGGSGTSRDLKALGFDAGSTGSHGVFARS